MQIFGVWSFNRYEEILINGSPFVFCHYRNGTVADAQPQTINFRDEKRAIVPYRPTEEQRGQWYREMRIEPWPSVNPDYSQLQIEEKQLKAWLLSLRLLSHDLYDAITPVLYREADLSSAKLTALMTRETEPHHEIVKVRKLTPDGLVC